MARRRLSLLNHLHALRLAIFCTLYLGSFSPATTADQLELVIVHTNDFHGHIKEEKNYAGAARISALVSQQRKRHPRVIFLDAGDAISGTPVSTMFKGLPIFEVMNLMNYDVGLLGNHEFDHGYKEILKFRETANHPLLASNALDPEGNLIADMATYILEIKGIRIGFIGVITQKTPSMITPLGNAGLTFLDPETVVKEEVMKMRSDVDLLVVLSHLGHEEDKDLADAVSGIDLIIGGHSHTYVNPPVKIDSTYVTQAHRYGTQVGLLKLTVDTDKNSVTQFSSRLIPAASLPLPDPVVLDRVNFFEEQVEHLVDMEITRSSRKMSASEIQAMFEKVLSRTAKADFGYYNSGGIRDSIPAGSITARHIWNIEPFANSLVTLKIKGSDYLKLLKRERESHPSTKSISTEKTYLVATNSFIGAHAVKAFGTAVHMNDLGILVRDVVIEHIKNNGLE